MKKLIFTLLILLLGGLMTAEAQNRYDELDYPELNEFRVPEVNTFTLDNGIKIYLLENRELPVINLRAIIRTGGALVPKDKTGLASMTGTVLRSGGSENYPEDDLNELLENRAAEIETGIGFTSGSARMNVLKEDFEELLDVFTDLMINPVFPEDKIDQAKTQTKSSISRRNDQQSQIANREFGRIIYGKDSIYGQLTEYETVDNISREDLAGFHEEHFTGNNMMIGVVGDFDAAEMRSLLEDKLSGIPAGTETEMEFPEINYEFDQTVNFIHKSDVNQSYVLMGHIGGMRDNPDYAKLQVMNEVLSGGFSGRLFKEVRSNLGLAYSVFGSYGSNSFYPGEFYTGVMTKSSTTTEAIDAIIREIERLQEEPITEEELRDTKDQFLNSLVFRYDSYDKVLNEKMSNDYRGLPEDAFDTYVEEVQAVTIEDVQEVAREYLRPDALQILVVGNRDEIGDQLEKYGEVNEIDISIPEPSPEEEQANTEGDPEKGRELIDNMASTLINGGTRIDSIRFSGEVEQMGADMPGGGSMTLNTTMTITYPDKIVQLIETPQGSVNMHYEDGEGTMRMGGQEQPLPPQQAQLMRETINRNYLSISMNSNELNPQYIGQEEYEETEYARVAINVNDKNITLLLSEEDGYPRLMRYTQFDQQQGRQVTVEEIYDDWRIEDGVAVAYEVSSFSDGEQTSRMTYESHEVNPE